MDHRRPLNRTDRPSGKDYADSSTHFSSVPMHLVTLTVPSIMSNFTTSHTAPNHDLQKMLHCQIQALGLNSSPGNLMCGSSCKHDLLLEAVLLSWQQSCTSPTTYAGVQAISICGWSKTCSHQGRKTSGQEEAQWTNYLSSDNCRRNTSRKIKPFITTS